MTNQYDTIRASMDATIQSIRALDRNHAEERRRMNYELADYLRQCKTMGFHIPRQCGVSLWLAQQLVASPDNYLFAHPGVCRQLVHNYERLGAYTCSTDLPKPQPFTSEQLRRCRTWLMLMNYIKESRVLPTPPKVVLVHEAGVLFDKVRITKFYDWLAHHPGVNESTEVILVN